MYLYAYCNVPIITFANLMTTIFSKLIQCFLSYLENSFVAGHFQKVFICYSICMRTCIGFNTGGLEKFFMCVFPVFELLLKLACLLQVFHFLYTYSVMLDICPFTLDEFAQAFHDKVNSHIRSFS